MKKLFSLIIVGAASLLPLQEASAQSIRYANEALMLSRQEITGSARIRAMGGASSSLGVDVSAVFSNPAGLGFYNRSDISFSPTFSSVGNDALYFGTGAYGAKTNLYISNFGLVLAGQKNETGEGWLGGNFGISYQRLNNFNNQFNYQGINPETGLIDVFVNNFDTGTEDELTDLAYSTYLVGEYWDENGDPISTLVYPPNTEFPYNQEETVTRSGAQNQLSIAYGGNFNDKFYIGGSIGFVNVDYRTQRFFTETYHPEDPVTSFTLTEDQIIRGSGLNATIGVIARPVPFLSVGLSYATPTVYGLEETNTAEIIANYNNVPIDDQILEGFEGDPFILTQSAETATTNYHFSLRTPGKLTLGSTFFFGKNGLITADADFLNYSNNRLSDSQNLLSADNMAIKRDYGSAVNLRIGGEYRYDIFRLRAGFAHIGDPYSNNEAIGENWDRSMNIITGGAGLKFRNYYVDMMVSQQTGDKFHHPYTFDPASSFESPVVNVNYRNTTAMLTLGLTF